MVGHAICFNEVNGLLARYSVLKDTQTDASFCVIYNRGKKNILH